MQTATPQGFRSQKLERSRFLVFTLISPLSLIFPVKKEEEKKEEGKKVHEFPNLIQTKKCTRTCF